MSYNVLLMEPHLTTTGITVLPGTDTHPTLTLK